MPQAHGGAIAGHETNAALCRHGLGKEMLESLIEDAEARLADTNGG